jgi:pimeloyl-ACP methyl ester carboxylesterase
MPPKKGKTRSTAQKGSDNDEENGQGISPSQSTFEATSSEDKKIPCERYGIQKGKPDLIFTHGASGGLSNPATKSFLDGFSADGSAVCFKGSMNLKSRTKDFHTVIESQDAATAALGGRSMGARAAVLAAKEHQTQSLILVSYPLIGQKGEMRDEILLAIDADVRVLFISGDNDHMCPIAELNEVRPNMQAKSWLLVVRDADHGMSLTPKAAIEPIREYTGKAATQWLNKSDTALTDRLLYWDQEKRFVVDDGWQAPGTNAVASTILGRASDELPEQPEDRRPSKRRKKI